MTGVGCTACGTALGSQASACGRCGMPVGGAAPAAAPADEVMQTTNRALLQAPDPPPPPPHPPSAPTWSGPHGQPPPPPLAPFRYPLIQSSGVPPEVAVVAIVLFALGGLLLYPVLRYGFPLLPDLFGTDRFERALAALLWFFFVIIGGCGVSFVLLAVGLWRGSRVCQLLIWFVCGVVGLSVLVTSEQTGAGVTDGVVAGIVLCCIVSSALLALPGARRHFVADEGLPLGVAFGIAVGRWYGTVIVLDGLILVIAGTVAAKLVAWGLLLALAGIGLFAVGSALAAGRQWARVTASACYVANVVFCFVSQGEQNAADSPATLVPLGVTIAVLVALWLPVPSNRHFATSRTLSPMPQAGMW